MRLRLKVLLGILISLILINVGISVYSIKKEIQFNKELAQKQIIIQDKVVLDIYKALYEMTKTIDNMPKQMQIDKEKLEYKLRQAIVIIYNYTVGATGSGVTIKYKDKFYILSAGHMADTKDDLLAFGENGNEIGAVNIIKHSYTTPEEDENGDFTQGNDLILLQPKNKNLQPKYYIELDDTEVNPPKEVYIIGNPAGIEDVLTDGRLVKYDHNFIYYIGVTYYGNSGGGIFTKDGKLVGIVSHMYPISLNPNYPPYVINGAVRLNVILQFLKDVI